MESDFIQAPLVFGIDLETRELIVIVPKDDDTYDEYRIPHEDLVGLVGWLEEAIGDDPLRAELGLAVIPPGDGPDEGDLDFLPDSFD